MGEGADGEVVHASPGVRRGGVQRKSAGGFEQGGGRLGVAALHRNLGLSHRKVVQQYEFDVLAQHVVELFE